MPCQLGHLLPPALNPGRCSVLDTLPELVERVLHLHPVAAKLGQVAAELRLPPDQFPALLAGEPDLDAVRAWQIDTLRRLGYVPAAERVGLPHAPGEGALGHQVAVVELPPEAEVVVHLPVAAGHIGGDALLVHLALVVLLPDLVVETGHRPGPGPALEAPGRPVDQFRKRLTATGCPLGCAPAGVLRGMGDRVLELAHQAAPAYPHDGFVGAVDRVAPVPLLDVGVGANALGVGDGAVGRNFLPVPGSVLALGSVDPDVALAGGVAFAHQCGAVVCEVAELVVTVGLPP